MSDKIIQTKQNAPRKEIGVAEFNAIESGVLSIKSKIAEYYNQKNENAEQNKLDSINKLEHKVKSFNELYNAKKQEMEILYYQEKQKKEAIQTAQETANA